METFLYIVFVLVCAAIILLVLIQQGKGAGVGFSMGGASQAMFGGSGGREFFIKLTSALAVVFVVICIILARMAVSDAGRYHGALAGVPTAPASEPGLPGGVPGVPQGAPLAAQPLKAMPVSAAQPAAPAQAPLPAKH